jgi:hypothetical protein
MEMMHHKKVESSPTMVQIMHELKHNYNAEISISDFCKWTSMNPSVLSPLIVLQLKFRKQLLGESYWSMKADQRQQDAEKGNIEYIRRLTESIKINALEMKKQRDLAKLRSHNKNDGLTDAQKNVRRKESVLLKAFNMVPNKREDERGVHQLTQESTGDDQINGRRKSKPSQETLSSSPTKHNTVIPTATGGGHETVGTSSGTTTSSSPNRAVSSNKLVLQRNHSELDSSLGNELKSRPSSSKPQKQKSTKSIRFEGDSKETDEIANTSSTSKKNRPKSGKSSKNMKIDSENQNQNQNSPSKKVSSKNKK